MPPLRLEGWAYGLLWRNTVASVGVATGCCDGAHEGCPAHAERCFMCWESAGRFGLVPLGADLTQPQDATEWITELQLS